MMFLIILFGTLIFLMVLTFVRAVKGPKLWDRLLAMNLITVKGILIIIVYASMRNSTEYLDVALIYALFGFISTIFLALFLSEHKSRSREEQ